MVSYTSLFRRANTPGSPMAQMGPGSLYQSISAQGPQQAGVFVTPNRPQTPEAQTGNALTPLPTGASPFRMALAKQMLATGASTAPVMSPLEGLARALQGGIGGYMAGQENRADTARQAALGERMASLVGLSPEQAEGLSPEQVLQVGALQMQREAAQTKAQPETWRPATTDEITAANLPASEAWLISTRGNMRNPNKSGQTINVGGKVESKLLEELVKDDADRIKAVNEEVDQLRGLVGDLKVIDASLEEFPSGALAPAKLFFGGIADSLGFDVEGVAEGQLAQAVISKLVPRMRPTGSGTTSDRDMALFRRSLPNLSNTVEGNRMIIRYFDRMMKRKAAEAEFLRGYAEENKSLRGATEAMIAAEDAGELAPAFTTEEREALIAQISEPETGAEIGDVSSMTLEDILALDTKTLNRSQREAVGRRLDELTPDL